MTTLSRRRLVGAFATAGTLAFRGLPAFAQSTMDPATEAKLRTLLANPRRNPENAARDPYRHPLETLKFFGLRQDMKVLEVWPAGGWWTEFLRPLLQEKGYYGGSGFSTKEIPVRPDTMDLVLTFRNIHNWMGDNSVRYMFDTMYASLKPGGYLGVEEHRAPANVPQDPRAVSGYVREDYAISLIELSGFKFLAKSEINANPKDTKDYPQGVWTLPPSYVEGAKDRDKYAAIGESDRFTLLFQKPLS